MENSVSKNLHEYSKKRAMQNYLDAEVREFAEASGYSADEAWELRVTTLARMLARTLNERESNSSSFEIVVNPHDAWNERLINLLEERTRVMSTEELDESDA